LDDVKQETSLDRYKEIKSPLSGYCCYNSTCCTV